MSPIRRAASVGLLALRYSSTASSHLLLDASVEAYRVSSPSTYEEEVNSERERREGMKDGREEREDRREGW